MGKTWNLREDPNHLLIRDYADGRSAGVIPLTYGRARIVLFSQGGMDTYDDGW